MSEFEYDVAISFLQEDEQLAIDIGNRIDEKFDVFIYSKRQEDLAGTDGQNTFSETFKSKARTVIVLYREEWGDTKWTRVEETAIKDRWFNNGYDFLLLIPLENAELPSWYPETMIYYDFQSFGLEGLPAVIYSHLKRNGAEEKKSSLESTIDKVNRDKKYKEEIEGYFRSQQSADDFDNQIQKFIALIREKIEEINESYEKINLNLSEERERYIVRHDGYELNFYYSKKYSTTSKGSDILFRIYKGYNVAYSPPDRQPRKIREQAYEMSKDRLGNIIWQSSGAKTYKYEELLNEKFEELIKLAS